MSGNSEKRLPPWENRIVGYSDESPDQLLASPWNWRVHPHSQELALSGTLHELGIIQNVICNRATGHVVDGHLRVAMAISQGQPTIPVTWVELSEAEEKMALATLDPLSALAGADKEQLDALLREVSTGDAAVQAMLAELAVKEGITAPDVEFKEYDESVEGEVQYVTCPECGHKFPK